MAGENPDDPRSGSDDEFLSKTKWQRFQVLIMGPVMNLILAVVVTAGVLMNGAEIPAFQSKPPVVGQVKPIHPPRGRHSARATASSASPAATSTTWEEFFIAVGTGPTAKPSSPSCATARSPGQGDAEAADAVRGRRIGVLPTRIRTYDRFFRAIRPRRPGSKPAT